MPDLTKELAQIDILSRQITSNPKDIDAYAERGHIYYFIDKHKEAIEDFSKALALDPEHGDDHLYLKKAYVYIEMNELKKALTNLNKAIAINPHEEHYYFTRSKVYYRLGNKKKGEIDIKKGKELSDIKYEI